MSKNHKMLLVLVLVSLLLLMPSLLDKVIDVKMKSYLNDEKRISKYELIVLEKTAFNKKDNSYVMTFTTKSDLKKNDSQSHEGELPDRYYYIRYSIKTNRMSYYTVYKGNTPKLIHVINKEFSFPPTKEELVDTGYFIDEY
ncbi:hypothetical protein DOK76_00985 [Vagococcus sp. DIV0080]|uniref:Uncharacterized protein n=1 Tax=Candidatus Vagococcus giribetii TaxID=2230876 RepID=A0ABS3HQX4_9ENTE|nr:hypothetical protein [Vagococcus sp. DIV0080]MBO0475622.1 hypothetical protein [Vagococcus sp. DIV0080]